jgi:hypothetical protein
VMRRRTSTGVSLIGEELDEVTIMLLLDVVDREAESGKEKSTALKARGRHVVISTIPVAEQHVKATGPHTLVSEPVWRLL